MSQRTQSTLILTAVFAIGLVAGVSAMVWAWPAVQSRLTKNNNNARRDPRAVMIDHMRSTLKLNDDQVTRMQAVLDDVFQKRTAIDTQFAPQFAPICDAYQKVRVEELKQFEPINTEAQGKIRSILTDAQWKAYQAQQEQIQKSRNAGPQGVRVPNTCRDLGPGGPGGGGGAGGFHDHTGSPGHPGGLR